MQICPHLDLHNAESVELRVEHHNDFRVIKIQVNSRGWADNGSTEEIMTIAVYSHPDLKEKAGKSPKIEKTLDKIIITF